MQLEDIFMILLAVVLCGIAFYMQIRESEHISKTVVIYTVIVLFLVVADTLMLQMFYRDNSLTGNIKRIALLSLMGPVAYTDFKETRIPNQYILLGLAYRVILIPVELLISPEPFWATLLSEIIAAGALFIAAVLCRLCIKNSIGAGDMKLFLVMGLLLGLNGIWSAVLISLFVSFLLAVFLLITKKKTKKDSIAFGPALAVGTFLSIFLTGM